MYTRIEVPLGQRAVVQLDGKPRKWLAPGRHLVFHGLRKLELVRLDAAQLTANLHEEQLALAPAGEVTLLSLGPHERALLSRKGRPAKWLGPGEHALLTFERSSVRLSDGSRATAPALACETYDLTQPIATPLTDEVKALVPGHDYVEATAAAGSVVLRYVDGRLDAVLPAGRHAAWRSATKVELVVIDQRERLLHVTGQEAMTKDRVTLRLNLSAAYVVTDPARLATVARQPDDALYLAIQLASRAHLAAGTLDELLADRESLAGAIGAEIAARAEALGLKLVSFGVKDVVLPGEMKLLLNRVIEAQKEAEANVIRRREETAATRSLAQTAKLLAENPLLVRLKELEAYGELAGKVGQVHLVLGEAGLSKLELKA